MTLQGSTLKDSTLRFTVSLHQVGEAFTRDGDHLDWFFQVDEDPASPVACFSTSVDVRFDVHDPATTMLVATRLPDHRSIYLDYDGEVSGNRGRIARLATGHFEWIPGTEPQSSFRVHSAEAVPNDSSTRLDRHQLQLIDQLRRSSIILFKIWY